MGRQAPGNNGGIAHFRVAENDWPILFVMERLLPSGDTFIRSTNPWLHIATTMPPEHVQVLVIPPLLLAVPSDLKTVSLVPSK
jgi:hypothetical protein